MLERIIGEFKSKLRRRENRTASVILSEFLKVQTRLKKEIDFLLAQIESSRRQGRAVSPSFLFEHGRLNKLLAELGSEIDLLSKKLGVAVSEAQRAAIGHAAEFTKQVFTYHNKGKLFAELPGFDSDAVRQIIGYSSNKTPLAHFFKRIDAPIAEKVKNALIYGVATGQGAREIASEINSALGSGTTHALHIARTETLGASRRASADFYRKAKLPGFVWMSALDPRTCLVCWLNHGAIFPTKEKPFLHVSCRCVLLPYFGKEKIQTGIELFSKLDPGRQRAILGPGRFELYRNGALLADFVGERESKDFGKSYAIKPLNKAEAEDKAGAFGSWRRLDEKFDPSIVKQTSNVSCVSAVGEMLLRTRGINVSQRQILDIIGEPADAASLAHALNRFDRDDSDGFVWRGIVTDEQSLNAVLKQKNIGVFLIDDFVRDRMLHAVVIEGQTKKGLIKVKDPFDQTRYKMTLEDFLRHWGGQVILRWFR